MKPTRRKSKFAVQEDSDPLSVVVNLFDLSIIHISEPTRH
mgnify:CR=1 FL=1